MKLYLMKISKIVVVIGLFVPAFHFACKPVSANESKVEIQSDFVVDTERIENIEVVDFQPADSFQESIKTKPAHVKERIKVLDTDPPTFESVDEDLSLRKNESIDSGIVKVEVKKDRSRMNEEVNDEQAGNIKVLDHSLWDQLLGKYVQAGRVSYSNFQKDPEFEKYLALLADNAPESSWPRDEQLAYWINAYNAFTIKLITDNYPVKSITDLHGGKPWDVKWIKLGNNTYSLNQIENEIIRPQFKEPRIHFAVNCAAKSCPPIANKAFTAANLEQMLEKQAIAFINNTEFNTISSEKVNISKIFEWYASDFGNIVDFINKYSKKPVSAKATISYKEYIWALNDR